MLDFIPEKSNTVQRSFDPFSPHTIIEYIVYLAAMMRCNGFIDEKAEGALLDKLCDIEDHLNRE